MLDRISNEMSKASGAPEVIDVLGAPFFVLSDGAKLPFVVGEQHVPPGYGVPTHMHAADDEFFYILEGELTIVSADGELKAGAGAWVGLPRKSAHGFHNAGDKPARMLVVLSPGVQALEMFRNFDQAGQSARLSPEAMMEIAGQYGVRFA